MQTNTPFWRAVQLSSRITDYQTHDVRLDSQWMPGADQVDDRIAPILRSSLVLRAPRTPRCR